MEDYVPALRQMLELPVHFAEFASGVSLRDYQKCVAERIIDSVTNKQGHSIVVIFPRQSGKNELQAHIEAHLLLLFSVLAGEIVKISPTWKPQSLNAMRRLERVLTGNLALRKKWSKEAGYIYRVGSARIYFLSGQPAANIVGATASTLLECDEAQDVMISKWDKEIAPMAASTNATKVFWGTAWTSTTLLAREMRAALETQEADGVQRLFIVDADQVGAEVPSYRQYVSSEIRKLGRNHPYVRTQYFSEMIDSEGGMFPPERQALMKGEHQRLASPTAPIEYESRQLSNSQQPITNSHYAFLLDVAGQDEAATTDIAVQDDILSNMGRDSHALTIVEIDTSTLDDELILAPRYLVRRRYLWTGSRHSTLYGTIKGLAELWQPRYIVIDATGVGAGLASFLEKAQGGWLGSSSVIPFLFNASTKSRLGWDFLAVIETGRFKDHEMVKPADPYQVEFWRQVQHTLMDISEGPNRTMKWGVPDGTRDAASGDLVHDDLVISAALCALLDDCDWGQAESILIEHDPLAGFDEVY
ncbi:MAG: hypothetical protein U9R58_01135 [Chloroflexota bacterium]|nr:hypothetical protein [Chloroflexota bacterium]